MWQSVEVFNVFSSLTWNQAFLKTKTFKKLEHRFLLENAMIENATFPYKSALLKANVNKTNRMQSIKLTYRKERCFATYSFVFLII